MLESAYLKALFMAIIVETISTISLKGSIRNSLTMKQASVIYRISKYHLDFIECFHSVEENNVFKNSSLELTKVNGKNSLV